MEGAATLVTGGKVPDAKETAPNEFRGSKIEGGETHQVAKGDAVVIPNGLPHQFTAVKGELHYFVCKPTAVAGSPSRSRDGSKVEEAGATTRLQRELPQRRPTFANDAARAGGGEMKDALGIALLTSWAAENNRLYRDEPYLIRLRRLRRVSLVILAVLVFLAGRAFAETNADAPSRQAGRVDQPRDQRGRRSGQRSVALQRHADRGSRFQSRRRG